MYTSNDIKQIENSAEKDLAISGLTLMQRAAAAILDIVKRHYETSLQIAIFCGSGNNGGDGYAAATLLKAQGKNVTCYYLKDPAELKEPALTAYKIAQENKIAIQPFQSHDNLKNYDLIIDAILGIGFKGDLKTHFIIAINAINQARKSVIALDVPSGLIADTGTVPEVAVKAERTVTFIALKPGLLTADAGDYCGEITVASLALPKTIFPKIAAAEAIDFATLRHQYLGPRSKNIHKGSYGHVAVIGGDIGMAGAVRMTSEAAARVGAGLTSAYTHSEHLEIITTVRPEIMAHPLSDPTQLQKKLDRATLIALGPGLGLGDWGKKCFETVLQIDKPKVLDADALKFLANTSLHSQEWILTPHPKEAALLLNITTATVQADRFKAIKQLQRRYGGVMVLKGAGTLVYDGKHPIQICTAGNPGMASGGMGDVLTGLIAGLVAQHIPLFEAACLGVTIHAEAGDRCASLRGERGMLASDLFNYIQDLIN